MVVDGIEWVEHYEYGEDRENKDYYCWVPKGWLELEKQLSIIQTCWACQDPLVRFFIDTFTPDGGYDLYIRVGNFEFYQRYKSFLAAVQAARREFKKLVEKEEGVLKKTFSVLEKAKCLL